MMMKTLQLLLLLFFSTHFVVGAQERTPVFYHPFINPPSLSCNDLKIELLSLFSSWEYQGKISEELFEQPTIWITNQKIWLNLNDQVTDKYFKPWQPVSVSTEEVIWQTDLPHYCGNTLIFVMKFKGK